MLDRYVDQVRLIVDVLPHIAKEEVFALKGARMKPCLSATGSKLSLFRRPWSPGRSLPRQLPEPSPYGNARTVTRRMGALGFIASKRVQILPDEAREFIALSEAVSEKLRDLKE